ncbi:MAG TPA: hypothetical protein VKA15_23420, partial [Isosphaeraceae bacterium]|nr:hypothetical protein [Isosphaeraceae bacterium]
EALAAAPTRMKIFDYGRTRENRRLVYAVIGSEANMRRLDEIEASMKRLADPRRTSVDEAADHRQYAGADLGRLRRPRQ